MWLLSLDTSFQCKPELKFTTDQALNTSSGQTWLLFPETSSFFSLMIIGLAFAVSTHEVHGNAWPESGRLIGFTRLLGNKSSSQTIDFHCLNNTKSQCQETGYLHGRFKTISEPSKSGHLSKYSDTSTKAYNHLLKGKQQFHSDF